MLDCFCLSNLLMCVHLSLVYLHGYFVLFRSLTKVKGQKCGTSWFRIKYTVHLYFAALAHIAVFAYILL